MVACDGERVTPVAPDQERVPNHRLRTARERAGATQDEWGDRLAQVVWELYRTVVTIPGGMVSKWERGERRPTRLYRQAYRVLCNASDEELGLDRRTLLRSAGTVALATLAPARPPAAPAPAPPAPEVVAAIRRQLLGLGGPRAAAGGDLASLARRVRQAWALRQTARYLALGDALPALLADAEAAAGQARGAERAEAAALLAHAYNAASSLLKRLGDGALASIAADRAVRAATATERPLLVAAAAYRLANVFLTAGRLAEAEDVALAAAASVEPARTASPTELATFGGLLLTAAVTAAGQGHVAQAWERLGQATVVARQLGRDLANLHTIFGPTNVAIHGVQIAAELGDGRQALRRAQHVQVDRLPPALLERRSHFLVDVARSQAQQADDGAAVGTLLRADRLAPEELRFDPAVRDLVSLLLRRERRSATPGLRGLAGRLGLAG